MKTNPYVLIARYRHKLAFLLEQEEQNEMAIRYYALKIKSLIEATQNGKSKH